MLGSLERVAGGCLLALVASATASSVASAAARAYVPNSGDGTISVIDTGTGDVIATIDTGVLAGGVAISPDGLRVYIAGLQGVIVIDAVANRLLEQPSISGRAQAVSVSADGSTVYVSGELIFAAYDSNTLAVKYGVPTTRTVNITLSPEGSRAFVADPEFAIFDVDLRTWEPRKAWSWSECRHPADTVASPDGARLYVICQGEGTPSTFVEVDLRSLQLTAVLTLDRIPTALAMTSDGGVAYIATPSANAVVVVDTRGAPVVLDTIPVGAGPSSVALTAAGDQLYVTNTSDNSVSVIDTATRIVIDTIAVGPAPRTNGNFIGPNVFLFQDSFE